MQICLLFMIYLGGWALYTQPWAATYILAVLNCTWFPWLPVPFLFPSTPPPPHPFISEMHFRVAGGWRADEIASLCPFGWVMGIRSLPYHFPDPLLPLAVLGLCLQNNSGSGFIFLPPGNKVTHTHTSLSLPSSGMWLSVAISVWYCSDVFKKNNANGHPDLVSVDPVIWGSRPPCAHYNIFLFYCRRACCAGASCSTVLLHWRTKFAGSEPARTWRLTGSRSSCFLLVSLDD